MMEKNDIRDVFLMNPQKILATGGSGFIGTNLI
jgi:nucleoside-diphosphate-sugar epimerase